MRTLSWEIVSGVYTMQMKFPSSNYYFFVCLNFIKHLVQVNYSVLRLITKSTGTRVEPAQIISIVNFPAPPPKYTVTQNFKISTWVTSIQFSVTCRHSILAKHITNIVLKCILSSFALKHLNKLLLIFYARHMPFPPGIENSLAPAKHVNRNDFWSLFRPYVLDLSFLDPRVLP